MITCIIDFCARNRLIVLTLVAVAAIYGWWSMNNVSLDAIPGLSDTLKSTVIEVIVTVSLLACSFCGMFLAY